MRRTIHLALVAAMALTAVAADEGPEVDPTHPCYDAETESLRYDAQAVWFHQSDAKVGNIAAPATWDTTKPATSVQGGAGAGTLTPGHAGLANGSGAEQQAVFSGTFDGCMDTLMVSLYSFDPTNRGGTSGSATPAQHQLGYTLTVDGNDVATAGPVASRTTFANSYEGMGPNLNEFAINIGSLMETYAAFDLLKLDGEHTIELRVTSWYVNTGHSVYVWDTSEVPSGLSFNTTVPEGVPFVG